MNIFELIVLSLALSMDSFASAVTKGIELKRISLRKMLIVGIWFSIFQSMMPIIGYFLASLMSSFLFKIDHWLSFFVLLYLGIHMIKSSDEEKESDSLLDFKTMFLLSIAISIDAFTVGITYSVLNVNLILASIITFIITFITTLIGVKLGNLFGTFLNRKALILGGLVLIGLGVKILLTHLNILS